MSSEFIAAVDGTFVRNISAAIMSDEALQAARAAFQDHCDITVSAPVEHTRQVLLRPHDAVSRRQCVLSFWNFALATEAERRIEENSRG